MDVDQLGLVLLHFSLHCKKTVNFDLVGRGRYRDNHMHHGLLCSRFAFVIIAFLCVTGCQQLTPFNWNSINPTTSYPEWQNDDKYMTTWNDKHRDLSKLRENAAGMSHTKQVSHATALSSQIKQEQVPVVRREMVRALVAFPVVEAEAGLEFAITDEDADIRVIACQAWGKRQSDRAFKLLLETWRSDTEVDVRVAAIQAIGNFNGEEVYAELIKALSDRDPAVQFAGIQGFRKFSGEDWGEDPETWIAWTKGERPEVIYDGAENIADMFNPANLFR